MRHYVFDDRDTVRWTIATPEQLAELAEDVLAKPVVISWLEAGVSIEEIDGIPARAPDVTLWFRWRDESHTVYDRARPTRAFTRAT